MREVTVHAVVTDPWDSPVRQLLVSWYDPERGQTYGARLPLTEGVPEPLPPAPPPDPIKARFPALTDADVAWVRQQQTVSSDQDRQS